MSLTLGGGPLAADAPTTVNYALDAPRHALFMHPFPRRVRAVIGGRTVLDSERGGLVHETGLLPVLYVPIEDIAQDLLTPSGHTTHCPYKGDAAYWNVAVDGAVAENAVWAYPEPVPEAAWLRGFAAMYWDAADAWYDEEEQVEGHLRDPFHRVDVRRSARRVLVRLGDEEIALTDHPRVLSETGLPNRHYLPLEGVRGELLVPSEKRTYCPYKGQAFYWHLRVGDREVADAAWSYPDPLKDAQNVREYLCFLHDELTVTVE